MLLLLLAAAIEARQIPATDQARLETALAAYNDGRTQEAESALRELYARYPQDFEILETLGLLYAARGEVGRGIPLLRDAYRVNGASPEAAANLGVAYLRLNRFDEAVATLRQAVSLDPKNSQTQSSYGRALMMVRRPREAARAFASASGDDPENADTLYNWALAEFDSGDAGQASAVLARIPTKSRSAQVESLDGDAQEKQGHFDRALACFQRAAQLEPSEANVNALGLELLKHWSFDAAIEVYKYGLSKYSSSSRLQTGLGIAFYGSAHYDEAVQVFSRLLASAPDQASYAKLLGQSCVALKVESSECCGMLVTYAQQHPADTAAARLAAATILSQHDSSQFDFARKLLQRAIAENPRSADGYYQMGVLDQDQEKWSDSVEMLKRADALQRGASKTHLRLALAYSHLEQKERAHDEAALQKQLRQSEDADMEAKRKDLTTFILEMH